MSTVRIAERTTTLLLPSPAPPVSCKICLLDSSTEINAVQNDKKKIEAHTSEGKSTLAKEHQESNRSISSGGSSSVCAESRESGYC